MNKEKGVRMSKCQEEKLKKIISYMNVFSEHKKAMKENINSNKDLKNK
jgi:hypothetical protein